MHQNPTVTCRVFYCRSVRPINTTFNSNPCLKFAQFSDHFENEQGIGGNSAGTLFVAKFDINVDCNLVCNGIWDANLFQSFCEVAN